MYILIINQQRVLHLYGFCTNGNRLPTEKKTKMFCQHTTKNESFVKQCSILKELCVDNYRFPLTLLDEDLMDVDPHKLNNENDPTGEIRQMVQEEATKNVWYFFRECVRLPVPGATMFPDVRDILTTPFKLTASNLFPIWMSQKNVISYSMSPTCAGSTCVFTLLAIWLSIASMKDGFGARSPLYVVPHVSEQFKERQRISLFCALLPEYFFPCNQHKSQFLVDVIEPNTLMDDLRSSGYIHSNVPVFFDEMESINDVGPALLPFLELRRTFPDEYKKPVFIKTRGINSSLSKTHKLLFDALTHRQKMVLGKEIGFWDATHYDLYNTPHVMLNPDVCYVMKSKLSDAGDSTGKLRKLVQQMGLDKYDDNKDFLCTIR